jgi:hypothetical protein
LRSNNDNSASAADRVLNHEQMLVVDSSLCSGSSATFNINAWMPQIAVTALALILYAFSLVWHLHVYLQPVFSLSLLLLPITAEALVEVSKVQQRDKNHRTKNSSTSYYAHYVGKENALSLPKFKTRAGTTPHSHSQSHPEKSTPQWKWKGSVSG